MKTTRCKPVLLFSTLAIAFFSPSVRWLLGTAVAVAVAAIGYYLWSESLVTPSVTAAPTTAFAAGSSGNAKATQVESSHAETDNRPLDQRIRDAEAFFAENLPKYRELARDWEVESKHIREAHPLIEKAADYGIEYRAKIFEKYRDEAERWDAQSGHPSDEMGELNQRSNHLGMVPFWLDALKSNDRVGDSTVGGIGRELLDNTEEFDLVKNGLAALAKELSASDNAAADIKEIRNADELVAALERMALQVQPELDEISRKMSKDPGVREYLSALSYANGIFGITQDYQRSWMSSLEKDRQRAESLAAQLRYQINSLPSGSDAQTRLASQLPQTDAEF